jgi:hypothetical protein
VEIAIGGLIPCRVQQGSNLFKREDDVASGFRTPMREIVLVHLSSSSATCAARHLRVGLMFIRRLQRFAAQ